MEKVQEDGETPPDIRNEFEYLSPQGCMAHTYNFAYNCLQLLRVPFGLHRRRQTQLDGTG